MCWNFYAFYLRFANRNQVVLYLLKNSYEKLLWGGTTMLCLYWYHSYMSNSTAKRLEQYTVKRPQEVLLVTANIAGEEDQIAIFRGFSSSLMRQTAFDPDVPVLPDDANILSIDRVASPYNPEAPRYIQQAISWETMENQLIQAGL